MLRIIPVLLVALLAACDGGGGTGTPTARTVTISAPSQAVVVGQSVQLSAAAQMSDGTSTSTGIAWSTLDPGVASVTAGLVTGLAPGTARIVASFQGRADTVAITVTASTSAASCTPATTLQLAVGGTAMRSGAEASLLCLEGGTAGAEYTLVGFYGGAGVASSARLALRAEGSGVVTPVGPPSPSVAASPGWGGALAAPQPGDDFHLDLLRRSLRELAPRVPAARAAYRDGALQPRRSLNAAPPQVGDLLSVNVATASCADPVTKTARVEAVGARSVVLADTTNPRNGFTAADYQTVAAAFDTLVYPINVETFGAPSDIDQNGRVVILYTRAVNELTPASVNYIVGGFFHPRDLFPRTGTSTMAGCATSNQAEMFYMLAPDPTGEINGNVRTVEYVQRQTVGTGGHELQHLINASRRLYVVQTANWEEAIWLNEGLSHIAEELLFYRAAGLGPRQNISLSDVQATTQRRDAFNAYAIANFGRFQSYLQAPEANSPVAENDDLATRGAAWAFLRYVADRRGGPDQPLWFALVNSTQVGVANLASALGTDVFPLLRDFNVALYTDDAVPVPPALQHPSWNYRSIYPALTTGRYPLKTYSLAAPMEISLQAGGGVFFRAGAQANTVASVRITAGGVQPPAPFTVTVVRTR